MSSESIAEFLGSACIYGLCLGPLVLVVINFSLQRSRKKRLIAKYGEEVAKRILEKEVWQGMTSEMVIDSIGKPKSVDESVLKTKKKEVWKYKSIGKGQYASRIILENDVVIGWEENRR